MPSLPARQLAVSLTLSVSVALLVLPWGPAFAASRLSPAAADAETSIDVAQLRGSLRFLASDELSGRAVGQSGNDLAMLYLSTAFERLGLEPGDAGFVQRFDLYRSSLGSSNELTVRGQRERTQARYDAGDDFQPVRESASRAASGAVAFAGYGITAPDLRYDDYAGVDVRGKIVIVLNHAPAEDTPGNPFEAAPASTKATVIAKMANAKAHGAVAVLIVPDPLGHRSGGRLRPLADSWPKNAASPSDMDFELASEVDAVDLPAGRISAEAAERILQMSELGSVRAPSIEALQKRIEKNVRARASTNASFVLPDVRATVTLRVDRTRLSSGNVIGFVRGADPAVRDEVVVVGAHLDHEGIDEEKQIFNGADDDGSGTVAVLAIADAFARAARVGSRPRRTVVFALWNAEERGSQGAEFYVGRPVPPHARPVANINLDMVGRSEDIPDTSGRYDGLPLTRAVDNANVLHVLGYSYSSDLIQAVREANREIGLTIRTTYDVGAQHLLERSDHWMFLQVGVPALFFTTGLHPDYHTPQDDVGKIDFPKLARISRLTYRLLWALADGDALPRFVDPTRDAPGQN